VTKYVATINVPGYLPMDDEPLVFDTPGEAWAYLRDERERAEDFACQDDTEEYSNAFHELEERAKRATQEPNWAGGLGTIYGSTPGSNIPHDLGLAYSVDVYEEEEEEDDGNVLIAGVLYGPDGYEAEPIEEDEEEEEEES